MPFIMSRIGVGDYEAWKPMFDKDPARARESALGHRLFRSVENPGEVFIQVEFATTDDARVAHQRLLDSGVLDRFADRTGPTVVEEAEVVRR
jgi:hypothetical protein